jgi:acyl dehydratase
MIPRGEYWLNLFFVNDHNKTFFFFAIMENINNIKYSVQYGAKDVILYALSIGMGSNPHTYNEHLRYVFEDHPNFSVVPTFALTFLFRAKNDREVSDSSTIPLFPPPLMNSMGVLPKRFLKEDVDLDEYPILHTSQAIEWINDLPVPNNETNVVVIIDGKFLSVIPKSIGSFVTTEYTVHEQRIEGASTATLKLLCVIRSTALVLGIPSGMIHPYNIQKQVSTNYYGEHFLNEKKMPWLELDCTVTPNTALLYRLASGDSNRIHVDPKAVPVIGSSEEESTGEGKFPILHGLCTLGIAGSIIMQNWRLRYNDNMALRFLECRFVNPIYINDVISIQASEVVNNSQGHTIFISFTVIKKGSNSIVVDNGRMLLVPKNEDKSMLRSNL